MSNSIDLTTVFADLMDEVYKLESVTSKMDSQTQSPVEFNGTAIVKVMKLAVVGMGNYSRTNGYPKGDVTATWETLTLAIERGRQFTVDKMDNEESLGLLLGNLIRYWMKTQVAPEIDAFRFAKYAGVSGILTTSGATLDTSTVLAAIDAASLAMDEQEVPSEGRILYVSSTVNRFLRAAITRILGNEGSADRRLKNLDEMTIVPVPQARFKTAIDLDAGASGSAGGYAPSAGAKDINFELIYPPAVVQATKLNQVKYFSPEVNQSSDGHLWQYRLYHDCFIEDNKVKGVYLHKKA